MSLLLIYELAILKRTIKILRFKISNLLLIARLGFLDSAYPCIGDSRGYFYTGVVIMKMWCPKLHKNHGWPLKIDSIPSSALFLLLLLFLLRLLLLGLRQRTPDPRNKAHAVKGMFCRTAAKTGIPLAAGVRG